MLNNNIFFTPPPLVQVSPHCALRTHFYIVMKSQGNNTNGSDSRAVLQEFLPILQKAHMIFRSSKLASRFRSYDDCFAKEHFSKPATVQEAQTRLELNMKYFSKNYFVIVLILLTWTIISNPLLLLLLIGFYFVNEYVSSQTQLQVGSLQINGSMKSAIVPVSFGLLIILFYGSSIMVILGIASIVSIGHAVSHQSMVDTDIEASIQQEKAGLIGNVDDE